MQEKEAAIGAATRAAEQHAEEAQRCRQAFAVEQHRAVEEQQQLRDQIDEGSQAHAHTWDDILHAYGTDAPDGVRLTVVNRIDNPEPD